MNDEPEITQLSARSLVRRHFEELSDDLNEFSLPDITDQVFIRVKADPTLLERLIEECLRPIVYDIGLGVMGSQRARRSRAVPIREAIRSLPPQPMERQLDVTPAASPAIAPRRQPAQRSGFDWLRHPVAVAPKQIVRLRKAVREDLERAIRFGGQGIESTRVSLAYYELVKEGLTSDIQTVAECYTDADLAALWQRAERRIATEDRVFGEVKEKIAAQRQTALAAPQVTT